MTETQKRIEAYQKALPGIREKVTAVAMLLALSVIMLTSASFAWLTISRAPEVTQVTTNVASNGNLEIALVAPDGSQPGESQVGDSSAAKGQNPVSANITWGNLVNLSDPSYGLENLALRPAQLNTATLLTSPLYGAEYLNDGRVSQLDSNFAYTTWTPAEGDKPAHFAVSENFGVRAISSTKIEAVGAAATYQKMLNAARNTNLAAANMYSSLGNNSKYMQSLATMMGLFMTASMNPDESSLNNPDVNIEDLQNLRDMYGAFIDCFDKEAEAMAALLNLQLFLKNGEGSYTPYTAEAIYKTTSAELKKQGLRIGDESAVDALDSKKKNNLEQFIKDRNTILADYEKMVTICSSGKSLKWNDTGISDIVNNLVNVGKCTIGADNTPINNIGASNAMGYLSGTQEARITNGILYRFEERVGGYIEVKNLSISATVKRMGITVPATVKANIQTSASRDHNIFTNDMLYTESLNDGTFQGGTPVAKDTYGLAIDVWVRTNSKDNYLTLEGNVLTNVEKDVPVTGKDINGNPVDIYTITRTKEETKEDGTTENVSFTFDLYKKETEQQDGTVTVTWYNEEDHTVFALLEGEEPRRKVEDIVTVTGFEGENRVWGDNELLTADSTTQGSGSCYVFYANTPEDQARFMNLLDAFNVAFIDDKGKLLASAEMDTKNYFAENGRVTVPLKLSSNSINLGENFEGNIDYAITQLEQNVATRITAIVYLDGTKLTNQEVLAASEIQGQLNIQFGSSEALQPIENEELSNKELRVSATVDKTSFDFDTAEGPMASNVTVHIDGDQPTNVTAFFMRAISSTQGSKEGVMTFTKNEGGDWISSYIFTSPGNYVLRSVQLDGVEYDLSAPVNVEVKGFAISSLSCRQAGENKTAKILTALNSGTVDLDLKFATNDVRRMPTTVQGRYMRKDDGSTVNVDFIYNSTTGIWSGSATFLSSGTYTLQYVLLDGKHTELDSGLWQTAEVTLGMRVAIYTTSPNSFKYVPSEMADNEKLLGMQVKILDDTGKELPGLMNAKLTYGMKGSGIKKMDTDLTWDGSYYVGELTTSGPGIWQFSNVTVSGNTLSAATTYPTFTVQSPEPPEYYGHSTEAYQYKPNNDAGMNVQIAHSAAATVQAYIIKDGAAEGTWVDGTIGGDFTADGKPVNNWNFTVPKDANGYQDGDWTLTKLRLWDVFEEDGTPYTEENPLEIEVSNNATKVVNRIYVSFATDKSQNFGKDANGNTTAQFMTSHAISGLNVDIKDFEGNAVQDVTDVQLTFTYQNGTSGTYGSYTSTQLNNATAGATITVALDSQSGATYSQSANATILYAGKYITTFSFKVSGTEYKYGDLDGDGFKDNDETDLPVNAPEFTVSSKAPTVTITSISTNAVSARFFSTTNPSSYDHVVTGLKNWKSDNGYSASVFIYVDGPSGPMDTEIVSLKYPTIGLKLEGLDDHDGVEFVVPNASDSSKSNVFTFAAGETTKSGTIGAGQDGTFSYGFLGVGAGVETWPKLYPAGKQTIRTIDVSYGDMDFVMTLSHAVNISQTTLPPYAELVVNESTYSGATKIYSEDTENVVLRKMEWTTTGIEIDADATIGEWSEKTIHTDHGYKSYSTWIFTTEKYMPFYWTEFSRTITGTQTPYTTTYTINKWIVNGKEYDVSKNAVSFKVTDSIQATAVVTVTTVYGDTETKTTTEVKYGYLRGSEASRNPGGSQIGATVGTQNGAYENPAIGLANTSTLANMYDDPNKYLECSNRG